MKRFLNLTLRALSSRTASFVLLAAWSGLLVMWVLPFQFAGLAEDQLARIATGWWPLQVVGVLVMLTTAACALLRASTDLRRLKATVRAQVRPQAVPLLSLPSGTLDLTAVEARLSAEGWSTKRDGNVVAAWRRRESLLGGAFFHAGIVLCMLTVVLSPNATQTHDFRLIETEQVGPGPPEVPAVHLRRLVSDATLEVIEPRYFEDVLLFEQLNATWERADGRRERFSLASPLWLDPLTTVSIQDYGLAPRFVVRTSDTTIVQDTTVAMSIFPPGNEDQVVLSAADLLINVSAFTDYGAVEGRDVSLSYNIESPRLRVAVSRGADASVLAARALLAPGESVIVEDGSGETYELVFEELLRYGTFRIARSFMLPLFVLGGLLMIFGMAVRFLRPRTEILAWEDGDTVSIACRVDRVGVSPEDVARRALGIGKVIE